MAEKHLDQRDAELLEAWQRTGQVAGELTLPGAMKKDLGQVYGVEGSAGFLGQHRVQVMCF